MKASLFCAWPLLLSVSAGVVFAQTAPPKPAPAGPTQNRTPAEIVPPGAPSTPAPGQTTTVVPDPQNALSPGSKDTLNPPEADGTPPIDRIPAGELDKALNAFRQLYIDPSALDDAAIKRATLQGLIDRLGPGADITPPRATAVHAASSPFLFEALEGDIGYVRLGVLSGNTVAELDAALAQVRAKKLTSIVLDLRAMLPGTHLDIVAEICRRFTPKGRILFTVKRRDAKDQIFTSKDEPVFRGITVALTDADTSGDAEIIGAVLRGQAKTMIIGEKTQGEAAEFTEVPLARGLVLRIATAKIVVDSQLTVFPEGLVPDLPIQVTPEQTNAALAKALEGGVAPLVFETERPRMNEAALVAGVNPELEQLAARARGERIKSPLRDPVLQRAVDFITTVSIYEKGSAARK